MKNDCVKHIKVDGRSFKLFKRNESRDGSWCLDTIIKGQRIQRSLETNNLAAAEQRAADEFIRPARAGRWEAVKSNKARNDYATIKEVFGAYREMCMGEIDPETVPQNLNSFRLVVRRGLGKESMLDEAVEELSTSVLTGKLVMDYETFMRRLAAAHGRDKESTKRTVTAYLRHARSLFKADNLIKYQRAKVNLPPTLKEFMAEKTSKAARIVRVPPDDALLAKTWAASAELKQADRPAYIAWLLAMQSLRRGEIRVMKDSWLQQRGGGWCVAVPKELRPGKDNKSKNERLVPLDENVRLELDQWKAERCIGLDAESEAFVIPSPRHGHGGPAAKDRGEAVFRRVDAWMRGLGWTTNHTMHEMRAYFLGLIRDSSGLDVAQSVAGHSDQRTTQGAYVGQKSIKGVSITLPIWEALKDHVEVAGTESKLL